MSAKKTRPTYVTAMVLLNALAARVVEAMLADAV